MKLFTTISILAAAIILQQAWAIGAESQNSNSASPVADGTDGLAPIPLTRINGDPAIGIGAFSLPGEEPGDKQGFARHMALAFIGLHPEILDHRAAALEAAKLYFTDEVQSEYIDDLGTPPANYQVWKGANEFQIERTFHSFIDEFGSVLAEAAPKPPFDFWVIEQSALRAYDFDRGGYKIFAPQITKPSFIPKVGPAKPRQLIARIGSELGVKYINYQNEIKVPDFMSMDAARAEELTNILAEQNDRNQIYFSAHVRVTDIETTYQQQRMMDKGTVTSFGGGILIIEIRSLELFADSDLTHLIQSYDAPTQNHAQ